MNIIHLYRAYQDRAFSILILIIAGLFSSCEKDPEPLFENGCIRGRCNISGTFDEWPELTVTAKGPYGSVSTTFKGDEEFWLKNLGNGTYDLECTGDGYGTVKEYGIQIFGNDTVFVSLPTLVTMPHMNFRIPKLTEATLISANELNIRTNEFDCLDRLDNNIRFFFGKDDHVSYENFLLTDYSSLNWHCEINIYTDFSNTFNSGDIVYIVGYVFNFQDQGYPDMHSGKLVYSTLNKESKSNVISFTMP